MHVDARFRRFFRIDKRLTEDLFNIQFDDYFAADLALLSGYTNEGMVEIETNSINATSVGEVFVRNLAMCFDLYMREKHSGDDAPTFSRTV